MARESGIKFICDLCGQLIEIGRPRYILKGDITCAYDGGTFDETSEMRNTTFEEEHADWIALAETRTEKELNDEPLPFQDGFMRLLPPKNLRHPGKECSA